MKTHPSFSVKLAVKLLVGVFVGVAYMPSCFATESAPNPQQAAHAGGIEWRKDNNLDAAFAQAKSSNKPLFLYWGAVWCPPCNQVKATIFNRQEFIEKSRHFVPVYLDGDSPGAQKFAAQFKVRGYPTMILLKADGTEITRLPGEVDSERYLQVLTLALNTSVSVNDTYKLAMAGSKNMKAEDWRLLADYSWDDPDQKLVNAKEVPATLLRLADACTPGVTATRLYLKGLFALATAEPAAVAVVKLDKAQALVKLSKALSDPKVAHDNLDLVTGAAAELTSYLTAVQSLQRTKLVTVWNQALSKLSDDMTISKADRLGAVIAQVALAKLDNAKISPALQAEVKRRVLAIDQATTDAYERQSVVHSAAEALGSADLLDDSDALLKAELKRSHSPYYFMSTLANNAKKRGDKAAALSWYGQAYDASKGPATRLQWGASYVSNLVELAPGEDVRIERTVTTILTELSKTENAFYERNRASLDRIGKKLTEWNKDGKHQPVFQKIHTQLDGICAKLPVGDPQKATCQSVLNKS